MEVVSVPEQVVRLLHLVAVATKRFWAHNLLVFGPKGKYIIKFNSLLRVTNHDLSNYVSYLIVVVSHVACTAHSVLQLQCTFQQEQVQLPCLSFLKKNQLALQASSLSIEEQSPLLPAFPSSGEESVHLYQHFRLRESEVCFDSPFLPR